MPLEQTINDAIKTAMLARNEVDLRSLRAIKAAILVAKTAEGANGEISEADEQKILQKLAKQRKDSLDIFRQQNREDLAVKEEEELQVIERFLPKQLDEAEVREILTGIIAQVGAAGPGDMGKVMGVATKQLAGKADGKMISGLVKELLAK
ncbi:GatB/YqeY domain-containing protein [Chitinophaga sedimenti]|uniref:GatB/YqeY domain-containing protein n=1 Tax=Chitinophaga sedimenti TaxID=2033606 RepID=UPI002002AD3F|nr:GatB/YqeY domain-containing protein [Chitinophaga sedimenti]MCK7558165.1 GatB/YqeY domain-containing protein [Chitinophaga sedimenti]